MLLYFWGMQQVIATRQKDQSLGKPLSADVLYMLDRAIRHSVIVELRAIHDRKHRSLGSGQIVMRLKDPVARDGLDSLIGTYGAKPAMPDVVMRWKYLDYVGKYCALFCADDEKSSLKDHPLSGKARLVRRMANKAVAHSTLDDYTLGGSDLGDMVLATVAVACAIEAAVGGVAAGNDFAKIESSGIRAAADLLHMEMDAEPHSVNMIQFYLPKWVETGQEFPHYPDDFERARNAFGGFRFIIRPGRGAVDKGEDGA